MKKMALLGFVAISSVGILFSCKKKEQKNNYTCTCPCTIQNGIAVTYGPTEIRNVTADEASSRCQYQTDAFNQNQQAAAVAAGKGDVKTNYVCQLERMLD